VLMHSLPFMIFQVGIGLFLYTEVLSLMWNEKAGVGGLYLKYPCFMTYVSFVIFSNIGSIFFMVTMLGKNWDFALNKVEVDSLPPLVMETTWDKFKLASSTVMAAVQEPLYFLWFWMTPRKRFCISFNLALVSRTTLEVEQEREERERETNVDVPVQGAIRIGFDITINTLLCVSMTMLLIVISLSAYVNWNHLPNGEGRDMEWRESSRTLPGSAILASGWVVVLFVLSAFVALDIYQTCNSDIAHVLKALVTISAVLMGSTGYLAHGGTIPGASGYYPGPLLHELGIAAYVGAKCLVTLSTCARRKTTHVVCELLVAVALLFSVVVNIAMHWLITEFAEIVLVVIWANLNRSGVVARFSRFTQVQDLGNGFPWPIVWELPPLMDDDQQPTSANAVQPSKLGAGSQQRFNLHGQPVSPTYGANPGYAGVPQGSFISTHVIC